MPKTIILQTPSKMNHADDAMLSAPSSPLPMSFQVNESTLSYCQENPKANAELIQKATTRLRCRLLQQGLIDAKSQVSHLQVELNNLRIELSTTENVLSKFGEPDDRQLLALERRFNTHHQQLDHLLSSSTPGSQQPKPPLQENAITASTSFSSTLSRMSSIFSSRQKPFKETLQQSNSSATNDTCSTTEYDNNDNGSTLDARERRMRRRQRVKQLRQAYQEQLRTYDPTWKEEDGHEWRSAASVDGDSQNEPAPSLINPPAEQQKTPKQQPPSEQQPNATEKKRPVTKQTPNTMKKPMMTSTKPIQPSKPVAAPCLCKRNKTTTNKADPSKTAASPHSTTYHSKQPEMVLLETQKHPLSPPPPLPAAEKDETTCTTSPSGASVLALPPSSAPVANDDDPPRPSNVSDWLLKQHEYHLQHQHDTDDGERIWIKKETLIDNQDHNATMDTDSTMKPMLSRTGPQTKQSSTVFEDVLRYLDNMSDFGNDSGLQQDISHLLAPMYNNSHRAASVYSSSSSASSIYSSLSWSTAGSQPHWSSLLTNQGGMVGKYCSRYLVDGVNKSLSWCKFLSVLSLALMISLGRGPAHMLLSPDDLDYLDLMADQGEPLVNSYYL